MDAFRQDSRLAYLHRGWIDVRPPQLPAATQQIRQGPPEPEKCKTVCFHLSLATANVMSMGRPSEGCTGKLDYLRHSISSLTPQPSGIQEARTNAGRSEVDGVLRLCSGDEKGHWAWNSGSICASQLAICIIPTLLEAKRFSCCSP